MVTTRPLRTPVRPVPSWIRSVPDWISEHLVKLTVGGWIMVNVAIALWPEDTTVVDTYEQYLAVWLRLGDMSSVGTEDRFVQETLVWLKPSVAELEDTAGPRRPALQHLLWIGRDHLLPVLTGTTQTVDRQEARQHFRHVARFLDRRGIECTPLPLSSGASR